MKILYFHQHFSTPAGSTGTRSYEFGKALVRAGHHITMICGSYCYSDSAAFAYFSGNEAHNTAQFNSHNQMPLISKFLFGSWLKCEFDEKITSACGVISWQASYKDYKGYFHKRVISVKGHDWSITDELNGNPNQYVIRWRLAPGDWETSNNICKGNGMRIKVESEDDQIQMGIVNGYESLHYLEKTVIPVLEIKGMILPTTVVTRINFRA